MKLNSLIFLILIYNGLFAQNELGFVKNNSRFQLGVNYSGDYCYRFISNRDADPTSEMIIKLRNEIEIPVFGYTTGLNFKYNLNNRIGFQLGLKYSRKGYQTKKSILFAADPTDPAVADFGKFIHHYYFIDIPLLVNYTVGQKKVKFISSFGLVNNIGIKQTNTSVLYFSDHIHKHIMDSDFDYSRYNISSFLSSGIVYNLNDKLSIRIEPYFMINTLKIIKTPIEGNLYSGGLDVSIWFNL